MKFLLAVLSAFSIALGQSYHLHTERTYNDLVAPDDTTDIPLQRIQYPGRVSPHGGSAGLGVLWPDEWQAIINDRYFEEVANGRYHANVLGGAASDLLLRCSEVWSEFPTALGTFGLWAGNIRSDSDRYIPENEEGRSYMIEIGAPEIYWEEFSTKNGSCALWLLPKSAGPLRGISAQLSLMEYRYDQESAAIENSFSRNNFFAADMHSLWRLRDSLELTVHAAMGSGYYATRYVSAQSYIRTSSMISYEEREIINNLYLVARDTSRTVYYLLSAGWVVGTRRYLGVEAVVGIANTRHVLVDTVNNRYTEYSWFEFPDSGGNSIAHEGPWVDQLGVYLRYAESFNVVAGKNRFRTGVHLQAGIVFPYFEDSWYSGSSSNTEIIYSARLNLPMLFQSSLFKSSITAVVRCSPQCVFLYNVAKAVDPEYDAVSFDLSFADLSFGVQGTIGTHLGYTLAIPVVELQTYRPLFELRFLW